ncbi:MAG: BamA/TamA family outer membrane protein [Proteobacteria bacterium]|nr:BamA/TamA family outer membrane protein [Pseudomonadota bacterium]
MALRSILALSLAAFCMAAPPAQADLSDLLHPDTSVFFDPQDGQFDLSQWLLDRKGFLPVPIVITEPAVGVGGGMAAVFFRQSLAETGLRKGPSGENVPPDMFAVAAAATSNGTKFGGVGGIASFADDYWRYRGGIGNVSANLDFYGLGGPLDGAFKVGYNLEGWISMQQVLRRIGTTNWWITGRWIYMDLSNSLHTNLNLDLPTFAFAQRNSGIGPTLEYDSRDNIFTPNRGWNGSVDATFYDPAWGSTHTFQAYRAHAFMYWPVADNVVIGGRIDGRTARGDVPFYMYPFIDMRGIPAARVQDENTALVEAEVRWNVTPRWGLVGFVGAGRAWGLRDTFSQAPTAVASGGGFRYLIASRLGLWVGVDYGHSQYDHAFYLEVGNAWR